MTPRGKRFVAVVITGAILALVFAILAMWRRGHLSEGQASLSFLGYTNHPKLGLCGSFFLTNGHPYHIAWVPANPESRTNGVWSRSGRIEKAAEMPIDSPILGPNGTATFLMVKTGGSNCWRVLVGCVRRDSYERVAASIYRRLPHDPIRVPGSLARSRGVEYVVSPEVPE